MLHWRAWRGGAAPFLWLSALSLTIFLREWSGVASWMIVPYLVWVSFASILNRTIVKLNGPFGSKTAA